MKVYCLQTTICVNGETEFQICNKVFADKKHAESYSRSIIDSIVNELVPFFSRDDMKINDIFENCRTIVFPNGNFYDVKITEHVLVENKN